MQKNITADNLNEVTQSTERPHHPTSPSKLQSLEWCPSYANYEREVLHEMTVRGTAQHDVVESGEIPDDMSDEDAAMAMERREFIKDRIQQLLKAFGGNVKMITEEYYPIDDKPNYGPNGEHFEGTTAGYLDCALVFNNETDCELHDWKFGNWAVEPASNNLQGMAYALGLCKRFPKLQQVTVFFHVPRVSKEPDRHTFSREYLEESARPRIEAVVSRSIAARQRGDFAMARPGYPVCAFCGHIADCPKIATAVSQVAVKYSDLRVPDEINPLVTLDKESQSAAMKLCHVVGAWAVAFKNRVKDRILEGKSKCPDDFMLISYREREIADPAKYETVVSRFITKLQYQKLRKAMVPTMTAIEKILRKRTERGKKDTAVQELKAALLEAGAQIETQPVAFLRAKRSTQNVTKETTEQKG